MSHEIESKHRPDIYFWYIYPILFVAACTSDVRKKKEHSVEKKKDRSLPVVNRYTRTLCPNIITVMISDRQPWVCTCHHISTD